MCPRNNSTRLSISLDFIRSRHNVSFSDFAKNALQNTLATDRNPKSKYNFRENPPRTNLNLGILRQR